MEKPSVSSSRTCQASCSRSCASASAPSAADSSRLLASRQRRQAAATCAAASVRRACASSSRRWASERQRRLMRVLAVDVDRQFGNLAHLMDGRRRSVEIGPGTSGGVEHAPQQQAVGAVEVVVAQPGGYGGNVAKRELGRGLGALATGADRSGDRPVRRARTPARRPGSICRRRFRRSACRTRRELELQPVDQDEIADRPGAAACQRVVGCRLQCSFSRSMAK